MEENYTNIIDEEFNQQVSETLSQLVEECKKDITNMELLSKVNLYYGIVANIYQLKRDMQMIDTSKQMAESMKNTDFSALGNMFKGLVNNTNLTKE